MKERYIIGKHSLLELIKRSPDSIKKVYSSSPEDPLCHDLVKKGHFLQIMNKQQLTKLVQSDSHQGFVTLVPPLSYVDCKDFLKKSQEKKKSTVVMIDSICDPQNLGAILRSSECFAVDLVILCKNRGCGITPVVSKTSVGGSELVPLAMVSNLVETMLLFQEAGYWSIAAEVREGATSLYDFSVPEKSVLVLGSEDKGIHSLLSKKSDFHLYIPMLGKIDSLNVSQAAAVFLSELTRGNKR